MKEKIYHLDCTLRDGGYYNNWDFPTGLVTDYLEAMDALNIDFVEIGFRSLKNKGFKGGFAYSKDNFLSTFDIPKGLKNKIGVMINGAEISNFSSQDQALGALFCDKSNSPVSLVRIACHVHEFIDCLPASIWLKKRGYLVGFNLMQIADRSYEELVDLATEANKYPLDVLYFADSMGSLNSNKVLEIVSALKEGWRGALGIHAHDNMGLAMQNTLESIDVGVTWLDSTVTGMGRGPGNTQTEYLVLATEGERDGTSNSTKLLDIIHKHFDPIKKKYGWGINPFYYLAGKHGIHPIYIQVMMQDSRYNAENIMLLIDYLIANGGKKFSLDTLNEARHFYSDAVSGSWSPRETINNREVLIIGAGHGTKQYKKQIETYIEMYRPYVIALNTQKDIRADLLDSRAVCHPIRLLADCKEYFKLPQPLIAPISMLPKNVKRELSNKEVLDFGLTIKPNQFKAHQNYCEISTSLVIAYALAIASSGNAKEVTLVGFDGFGADDARSNEMDSLFSVYMSSEDAIPLTSITPTLYDIPVQSIFGRIK